MLLLNLTCGQILISKFTLTDDLAGGLHAFQDMPSMLYYMKILHQSCNVKILKMGTSKKYANYSLILLWLGKEISISKNQPLCFSLICQSTQRSRHECTLQQWTCRECEAKRKSELSSDLKCAETSHSAFPPSILWKQLVGLCPGPQSVFQIFLIYMFYYFTNKMPYESDVAYMYGWISLTNTCYTLHAVCPSVSSGWCTDEFILQAVDDLIIILSHYAFFFFFFHFLSLFFFSSSFFSPSCCLHSVVSWLYSGQPDPQSQGRTHKGHVDSGMVLLGLLLPVAQPIENKTCDKLYVGTARRERGSACWQCPSQWDIPAT